MNFKKLTIFTILAFALLAVVMLPGLRKVSAASTLVVGNDLATCPSAQYFTIQSAVIAASPGDTIKVCAGTYNEMVSVNKTLTIKGAQAGVDARSASRTGLPTTESVVDGLAGSTSFDVAASDVTIDGFTVQGATNPNLFGAGIRLDPGISGTHLVNNIIQNNTVGLFLANTGTHQAVIQFNLFRHNTIDPNLPADGHGIYTDEFVAGGAVSNVLIDSNKFTANIWGIGISNTNSTGKGPDTNLTIQSNTFDSNSRGMYFFFTNSSSIKGNVITNTARYGIGFFGSDNGFTIQCNSIQNNPGEGILVNGDSGLGTNSNITVNDNNISKNVVAGLEVDTGSYTGGPGSLNAERNWWGSATGPTIASNPGGTGDIILDPDGVVDYRPFLTSVQGLPCPTPAPKNERQCQKALEQQERDFEAQQKADKKAFESKPHTEQQEKAFDAQQRAGKRAFDQQMEAAERKCEQLPDSRSEDRDDH